MMQKHEYNPLEDGWYSVAEVAERLGVEVRTVRKWIRAGDIAALRIGGRSGYKISELSVAEYMARHEVRRPRDADASSSGGGIR